MTSVTFEGRVTNGRLVYDKALTSFEGRQVYVTVIAPSVAPEPENILAETASPDDLDVEKDISVKMPRPNTVLEGVQVVSQGLRKPHVILPEELPDA